MLALLAMAFAVTPPGPALWAGPEVDPDGAIYAVSTTGDCGELEILDDAGAPVALTCSSLGSARAVEVLRLLPDPAWPGLELELVHTEAGSLGELPVGTGIAGAASASVPVGRTVTESGVSYDVCHNGVISAVVRASAEPTSVGGDAVFLGPDTGIAYFGAGNGAWADAGPGAAGTFWFATWGEDGTNPGWTRDEVTLAGAGKVRVDVRFGFDPSGAGCPDPDASWSLGDELDALGGPNEPVDTGSGPDDRKGCGCQHSRPADALWLGMLLVLGRRRYHSPST